MCRSKEEKGGSLDFVGGKIRLDNPYQCDDRSRNRDWGSEGVMKV